MSCSNRLLLIGQWWGRNYPGSELCQVGTYTAAAANQVPFDLLADTHLPFIVRLSLLASYPL